MYIRPRDMIQTPQEWYQHVEYESMIQNRNSWSIHNVTIPGFMINTDNILTPNSL